MQLRYNFRLYPTPGQCQALARAFGCARVVYNDALRARQQAHASGLPYITDSELSKQVVTEAKKIPERAWLSGASAVVLPQAVTEAGVDLGLTHFAVLSDGRKIGNPRFLRRAERRLRKAQQALSRKAKGSSNRAKARARVAKAHARVADARRDFTHKLSTQIIRDNQAVMVEDLCVKGLARTKLAKSVHDAGWAQFAGMLEYKAARYGRTLVKVDRWFPSSKLCSACGTVAGSMPLNVRSWTCAACGTLVDRDVNAAINILAAGRAERLNACGGIVRPAA
ncbi:RNA-guided endonuclease TnpB family protein [Nonomuraea sp. B10E15]|uniref:RNA-guided endonuclease InsQ/TnpB family protein n=1 Tax=Nonomuraea sp. B10E15 TaxID=3153560 RepID=UPI00325E0CFA